MLIPTWIAVSIQVALLAVVVLGALAIYNQRSRKALVWVGIQVLMAVIGLVAVLLGARSVLIFTNLLVCIAFFPLHTYGRAK